MARLHHRQSIQLAFVCCAEQSCVSSVLQCIEEIFPEIQSKIIRTFLAHKNLEQWVSYSALAAILGQNILVKWIYSVDIFLYFNKGIDHMKIVYRKLARICGEIIWKGAYCLFVNDCECSPITTAKQCKWIILDFHDNENWKQIESVWIGECRLVLVGDLANRTRICHPSFEWHPTEFRHHLSRTQRIFLIGI